MPLSPSSSVIALLHAAVVMNAGSKNQTLGSSLRHSVASTPPSTMGTSIDSHVRLLVIVMDSGINSRGYPFRPARTRLLRDDDRGRGEVVRDRSVDRVADVGERLFGMGR